MSNVNSPCINKCKLDETRTYCISCLRYTSEIKNWSTYTDEEKQLVVNTIRKRKLDEKTNHNNI